jgi:hypothetical protein
VWRQTNRSAKRAIQQHPGYTGMPHFTRYSIVWVARIVAARARPHCLNPDRSENKRRR